MLPLDSPRWKELRQAYGSAGNIPKLIMSVSGDDESAAWEKIWSSLCHQFSIYSATYGAIPHLVSIAEHTSLKNQLEVLILCSTIRLFGRLEEEDVPEDLIEPYNSAMSTIRKLSLGIVQEAVDRKLLDRYPLPYLIQAVLGLQFGAYSSVCFLQKLAENDCEVEAECPECDSLMFVDLTSFPTESIDQSARAQNLKTGLELIRNKAAELWPSDCIVQIAGALASTMGDDSLSEVILNLRSEVTCDSCGYRYQLLDGFDETSQSLA